MRDPKPIPAEEKALKESLWTKCLFEVIALARKEGKDTIDFKDVDALVIKKSQETIPNA
jgi:hypothetical protein